MLDTKSLIISDEGAFSVLKDMEVFAFIYFSTWPFPAIKESTVMGSFCRPTDCCVLWFNLRLEGVVLQPIDCGLFEKCFLQYQNC